MQNKTAMMEMIRDVASKHRQELGGETVDEMAVPAYTQGFWLSRYVFWRKLDWVIRLAGPGPVEGILDYGCGTGILLPTWSTKARRVFAADLHMELARDLSARMRLNNIEFINPECVASHISDGSLDVVIAANVLEHVEDRKGLARIFAKKLRPTGRLVVSGPTENALYHLGRRMVGFSGDYHVTNISGVVADVLAGGFRVKRRRSWPLPGPMCLYEIYAFETVNGRDAAS